MNNLKYYRLKHNLSQKEVADHLGIAQSSYAYWENGKVKIDEQSLSILSNLYKVHPEMIFARETKQEQLESELFLEASKSAGVSIKDLMFMIEKFKNPFFTVIKGMINIAKENER